HTVSFDESFGKSSEWMIPNSKKNTSMKTTQSLSIPKIVNTSVIIDGDITSNEYSTSFTDPITSIIVFWEHNSINLTVGLISPLTGWVSFGIVANESRANDMDKSNMILGGFENGFTYALDLYGTGGYSHENDTENGGFDNILEATATENTTHTVFEFIIPLNSTDQLDPTMEENTSASIFVGNSASDTIVGGSHSPPGGHSATIDVFLRATAIETRGTSLTLQVDTEIHQGNELSLSATLRDNLENPLGNRTIVFFLDTQFGILEIDQVDTNILGEANTSFIHPTLSGNLSFGVKFNEEPDESGSVLYLRSATRHYVMINPDEEAKSDPIRAILGVIGLFIASGSLFAVWGFYGLCVLVMISFLFAKKDNFVDKNAADDTINQWSEE
ncbi:MAG: DOMON domain-containing protein, partial [Candidatus Hodarchaeales archaeon]